MVNVCNRKCLATPYNNYSIKFGIYISLSRHPFFLYVGSL